LLIIGIVVLRSLTIVVVEAPVVTSLRSGRFRLRIGFIYAGGGVGVR
jgi:hypothetical protein